MKSSQGGKGLCETVLTAAEDEKLNEAVPTVV
jgi:hypothetical protein